MKEKRIEIEFNKLNKKEQDETKKFISILVALYQSNSEKYLNKGKEKPCQKKGKDV